VVTGKVAVREAATRMPEEREEREPADEAEETIASEETGEDTEGESEPE
jgi:hypothetical protein